MGVSCTRSDYIGPDVCKTFMVGQDRFKGFQESVSKESKTDELSTQCGLSHVCHMTYDFVINK